MSKHGRLGRHPYRGVAKDVGTKLGGKNSNNEERAMDKNKEREIREQRNRASSNEYTPGRVGSRSGRLRASSFS